MQQRQLKVRGRRELDTRKFTAIIAVIAIISLAVLFAVFSINNPPMESIPVDGGWIGFFFIFANGFLLSYILDKNRVGILERTLLTIGLGFGLTFVTMILLGFLWQISLLTVLLTQGALLVTLGTAAVLMGFRLEQDASSTRPKSNINLTKQTILQAFLLIIIGALAILAVYDTLSLPATEWDSLAYGVNYAKIIFQNENIPLIAGPSIGIEMSAPYPPGVQVTAAFLYTLAGNANDFYYRALSPIFSLATLIVTYKFAMMLNKNRTFSVYAVSALTLIPFFWELFIQETYLMALTFMLTMSTYFFFKAYESNSAEAKKYEVIGVLFCGFASLTSYIGLFAFGILLLYAVQKKLTIKHITWLIALGLVVVLTWYLRNLVLLGNPVYPFMGIGQYLDPLLRSSTTQHFQNYTLLPLYGLTTLVCKVGVGLLAVGIVFFSFSKRKELLLALPLYLLLVSVAIMAFHVAFPRYLIIALPTLAVVFSTVIKAISKTYKLPQIAAVALISLVVLTSAVMVPYINTVKPQSHPDEDESHYLSRIYEEGDAWQWINQNTPTNAKIATFDIKEYYLNREVFALDGNESAPLYQMSTIEECITFLQDNGVSYVLSVPWASPMDIRLPPAYMWCPLMRYLGDFNFLPPLFVGINGTTVYHVGALDETTIYQAFSEKNMVPPLKQLTVNVTITNSTYPYTGKCYVPIPVDYRTGNITASVNSSKPIDLELWNGLILTDKIDPATENFMIAKSPYANSSQIAESTLQWHIDKAGYFTLRVIDKEESFENAFNVTLKITFYNFWDLESA
jgi:hypothetical protein